MLTLLADLQKELWAREGHFLLFFVKRFEIQKSAHTKLLQIFTEYSRSGNISYLKISVEKNLMVL